MKILNDSKRRLQKLKILENFFKQPDLVGIAVRTEIIHSFFEKNIEALDASKLELFHLQYTDSLIELLRKLKKQKEATILNIDTEINAHKAYLAQLARSDKRENSFETDQRFHEIEVSALLEAAYSTLTGLYKPYNLSSIRSFPNQYAQSYFRDDDDVTHLLLVQGTKLYTLEGLSIERLLLSRLATKNFKLRFVCGYCASRQYFELFRILGSDDEFIWNLQTNGFYLLKEAFKHQLNREKNTCNSGTLEGELDRKIGILEEKRKEVRNSFPDDVKELLKKYRETIDNNNLTDEQLNIEEEKNILNSMLDLNFNN